MLALQFTRRLPSVRTALAQKSQQRGYCAPAPVTVPIDLIKQLRTKTKAGISDCRAALVEAGLDLTKAEELLQKRAKGVVEKKSSRVAAEGLLAAVTDVTNKKLAVVELLCETDFASRAPSFGQEVVKLAQTALAGGHDSREALLSAEGVKEQIDQMIFTLRENVALRRVLVVDSPLLGVYMHQRVDTEMGIRADTTINGRVFVGGKLAVVDFGIESEDPQRVVKIAQPTIDKLAVHVMSMDPKHVDKESAPAGADPEDILMDQEFGMVAEGKSVSQVLAELQKKLGKDGSKIVLKNMHRLICGEGIEKKSGEDFGNEVAALLNKKE